MLAASAEAAFVIRFVRQFVRLMKFSVAVFGNAAMIGRDGAGGLNFGPSLETSYDHEPNPDDDE